MIGCSKSYWKNSTIEPTAEAINNEKFTPVCIVEKNYIETSKKILLKEINLSKKKEVKENNILIKQVLTIEKKLKSFKGNKLALNAHLEKKGVILEKEFKLKELKLKKLKKKFKLKEKFFSLSNKN